MKLIRWILVTIIVAVFVFGIMDAICEKIKTSLIKSGGVVLASDFTKLGFAPYYTLIVIIVISVTLWYKTHGKN